MNVTYDVTVPPFIGGGKRRSEEAEQVSAFLDGTWKNMCLTYDDEATAKNRVKTLRDWARRSGARNYVDILRSGMRIYVVRLNPAQVKARKGQ